MALVVACGPTDFLGAGPGDALYANGGGGFALHEALLRRIDGVSEHHVVQFPRLVAVRSRFEVVWCPKCRPPRQIPVKTGCFGRGGLRFGHNGACRGVLFARKPLNMRVNPLIRTSTPQHAPGRRCPRADHRAHVRVRGARCEMAGLDIASGPAGTAAWPCWPGGPVV